MRFDSVWAASPFMRFSRGFLGFALAAFLSCSARSARGDNWSDTGNFNTNWFVGGQSAYVVSNAQQLAGFAVLVNTGVGFQNTTVTLATNVDLSSREWTPIGATNSANSFRGVFDGGRNRVTGLTINRSAAGTQGFFGKLSTNAVVQHVVLTNCSITAAEFSGCVVAYNNGGTVLDCCAAGSITGTVSYTVGGVVGLNNGWVINCCNLARVYGAQGGGGVAGYNAGSVMSCFNVGNVSGTLFTGGLVGYNVGRVFNGFNTGSVSGSQAGGGVTGYSSGEVQNCYSRGSVSGSQYWGGVAGFNEGDIRYCYWKTGSGATAAAGINTGTTNSLASFSGATGALSSPYPVIGNVSCTSLSNALDRWVDETNALPLRVWRAVLSQNGGYPAFVASWGDAGNNDTSWYTGNRGASAYVISNAAQFAGLAALVNDGVTNFSGATVSLAASLDLAAYDWTSVGRWNFPFCGTFDGRNLSVLGLRIGRPFLASYQGLFGAVKGGGAVRNVTLLNATVTGGSEVGGIVGYAEEAKVVNCVVSNGVIAGFMEIGGVVGAQRKGVVRNCMNSATVKGDHHYIGGVVGHAYVYDLAIQQPTVENCLNSGTVSGPDDVGGIIGQNDTGNIQNCFNVGTVSSTGCAGGLAGYSGFFTTVQFSYWKTGAGASKAVGSNSGMTNDLVSFGAAPGTLSRSVAIGDQTCLSLLSALTTWCSACGETNVQLHAWRIVEGQNSGYPVLYAPTNNVTVSFFANGGIFSDGSSFTNIVYSPEQPYGFFPVTSSSNMVFIAWTNRAGVAVAPNDDVSIWTTQLFAKWRRQPWSDFADTTWFECDPTQEVYVLSTARQLAGVAALVNSGRTNFVGKTVRLASDLDISGVLWEPIGYSRWDEQTGLDERAFGGVFDGNGKTLSGLTIMRTASEYGDEADNLGLFGVTSADATVHSLTVTNSSVVGRYEIGSIVGYNQGQVWDCSNGASVVGEDGAGGIVGGNDGIVERCGNSGAVTGDYGAGGLCGWNEGRVCNCGNFGTILGAGVGGVVGDNWGTVQNSFNTGSLFLNNGGWGTLGGLLGYNEDGLLQNGYNSGSLSGFDTVYGLVGDNEGGVVEGCYWRADCGAASAIGEEDSGDSTNTASFIASTLALSESLTVSGVACSSLTEALNAWVAGEAGDLFLDWAVTSGRNGGCPLLVSGAGLVTVSFRANGGLFSGGAETTNVIYGAATPYLHFPDVARSGWLFAGWTNSVGRTVASTDTVDAATLALNARWVDRAQLLPYADNLWSAFYGLSSGSSEADADADGVSDFGEWLAGTDPTNATDQFTVYIHYSEGQPEISWSPDLGAARTYTVETKITLTNSVWEMLSGSEPHAPMRFFRVRVDE